MGDRPDRFLPLFIADYLADTAHLTRDQHGAYLLLLMAYWRKGGPLPDNNAKLANIVRASHHEWKKLRPVMLDFFTTDGTDFRNKRSDHELERAEARSQAKANSGRKGAEVRWQRHSNAIVSPMANGMAKNSSSPIHPTIEPKEGSLVGARQARATRWPPDAIVSDEWLELALQARSERQLPSIDLRLEATKFANYWASKSGGAATKLNWQRTWINWALESRTKANGTYSGQPRLSDHPLGIFGEIADEQRARRTGGGGTDD